ncbi:MAG TPA: hypothetical protein VLM91_04620 [Candidatus Methylomirabilis sp.]|nr:hypothetical protein [Candidatus Methylomirabilis sp.]
MNGTKRLEWREALKVFRERMGGLTDAKKAYFKADRDTRKALREALRFGPKTIPELTQQLNIAGEKVTWYVMALKRYGEIVEAGQAGEYFRYALKESER